MAAGETRVPMQKASLRKGLLLTAGWLSVFAGLLGILLPVLPTTPFLLLAAFCFSRSSERLHRWMINHPWFGPPIRQWQENHTISRGNKQRALALILISFSLTLFFAPLPDQARLLLVLMAAALIWMVARLPQSPTESAKKQKISAQKVAADYEQ